MYKKWSSLILILVMAMVISSVGCSESNESGKTQGDSVQGDSIQNDSEKILKIYYAQDYYSLNNGVLNEFKKIHGDIKIEEEAVNLLQYDTFISKFTTELLSGEGPDIISLPSWCFPSSYNIMEKGLLTDLNPLISEGEGFKIEDYREEVLNTGVYNGKRYIIPLDYSFSYFYTYKTLLDKSNIKLDTSKWTWENLVSIMKEYYKEGKGSCKYFFSSGFSIWDIISSSVSYVDYKNKTSNFNSPEFIKLLQTYKDIIPYICPQEETNGIEYDKQMKLSVLQTANCEGVSSLILSNDVIKKAFGEDAIILPFPNFNGKKQTNSFASNLVAITSKCKYQNEASDFIKIIMSDKYQKDVSIAMPVMNSVFNKQFENVKNIEKVGSQISNLFQNIAGCTLSDGNVQNIIAKELPDFVSGKKSAEQTAKAIDEKVMILLNE